MFDSLIHLQDSQTHLFGYQMTARLIHLFTYKTLKLRNCNASADQRLIHLFTYKTLKPQIIKMGLSPSLTHRHML